MVNPGHPSRGCHSCRRRKIKCDEKKPQCHKCSTIGKSCPGYREPVDVVFRDQNAKAKEMVQKRKKSPDKDNSKTTMVAGSGGLKSVPRSCYVVPEHFAINRFYQDYTISSGYMKILDFLPGMIERGNVMPCLEEAAFAASLAATGQQLHREELISAGRTHYVKALSLVNKTLQDPELVKSDSLIVSVFLLGTFELINGERPQNVAWSSHTDGLLALLKIRGKDQFHSPIGRGMARLMHYQILMDSFLRHVAPPEEIILWSNMIDANNLVTTFTKLALHTAQHCAEIHSFLTSPTATPSKLQEDLQRIQDLLATAVSLDQKIQRWSEVLTTSSEWRLKVIANQECASSTTSEGSPPSVHIYPNLDIAGILNICRTVRLILCCMILSLVERVSRLSPQLFQSSYARLETYSLFTRNSMVEDICSSVAWILGEVDDHGNRRQVPLTKGIRGYILLWPLRQVLELGQITLGRRHWIIRKLEYIGEDLGYRYALQIAEEAGGTKPARAGVMLPERGGGNIKTGRSDSAAFLDSV